MISGNQDVIERIIDLSQFQIKFSSKPLIVGGLAMEYYGLRKCGHDIDLIISDEDYQTLADRYPACKIDTWGDMGVRMNGYELLRSISRLDYDFFADGASEFPRYKIVSFEKLFFMTAAAVRSEPEVQKRIDDFGLTLGCYYENHRNQAYVQHAQQCEASYLHAPDGTIFADQY
ncbi:MAG: hypothetical protein QM689_05125 [Oscillospiraceae bacterium]